MNINFNYILKERLKIQEECPRDFLIAKKHDDLDKEADKSYYKEKPILSLLLAIYFFPTNLLRFVSLLRAMHIYHKCKSQVEVLKKEVEKTNKWERQSFNFGLNPLIKRLPYHNLKMKGKFWWLKYLI